MSVGNHDMLQLLIQASLVVKIVLLILLLASIFSWGIVLNKWQTFKLLKVSNLKFLKIYSSTRDLEDVLDKTKDLEFSPFRIMFVEGFNELKQIVSIVSENAENKTSLKDHFQRFGLGAIERSLSKGATLSNIEMDRGLSSLATIGAITPFIGLFGTVWGIVNSFSGLASGGATLDAVAPGIAEALIATAIGLAAAIPAVWFYNFFSGKSANVQLEMENFGKDFLNTVERKLID